ncbi:unnamed protein product [Caenorhabditis nigoni]
MTFQSILIILIHIDLIFGASSGRLSSEENENRLNTCETEAIPTPSTNETAIAVNSTFDFLWIAHSKFPNASTVYSAASPISSRHFLTFSNTILDSKRRWLHNGSIYTDYCTGNTRHAEVPEEVVKLLRFSPLSCYNSKDSKCKNKTTTAVRAFLLYICHKVFKDNFPNLFSPMIVEMKEEFIGTPLCLSGTDPLVKVGDQVHAYRFSSGIGFKHSSHIVKHINDKRIETTRIEHAQLGGPLVKFINAKPTIVGFIGNGQTIRTSSHSSKDLKMSTEATRTEVITSRATSSEAPTASSKVLSMSTATSKASSSLATLTHLESSTGTWNPKIITTSSSSSDSPISLMFTLDSKTTATIPTPKLIQKPTTSTKPESEYDYEEYEEEQEFPMSQELKYEDFLDQSVENGNGRKKIWIGFELFFVFMFSWILV